MYHELHFESGDVMKFQKGVRDDAGQEWIATFTGWECRFTSDEMQQIIEWCRNNSSQFDTVVKWGIPAGGRFHTNGGAYEMGSIQSILMALPFFSKDRPTTLGKLLRLESGDKLVEWYRSRDIIVAVLIVVACLIVTLCAFLK